MPIENKFSFVDILVVGNQKFLFQLSSFLASVTLFITSPKFHIYVQLSFYFRQ